MDRSLAILRRNTHIVKKLSPKEKGTVSGALCEIVR